MQPEMRCEPGASPLLATSESLRRSAPAYIALARCDVLFDEGVAYAQALQSHGIETTVDITEGAPHGFVSMLGLAEAQQAVSRMCAWISQHMDAAVARGASDKIAVTVLVHPTPKL